VHRPELAGIEADVVLPEYLQRPGSRRQDIRSGMISPVKGSSVSIVATATRDLAGATVDGEAVQPTGTEIHTPARVVDGEAKVSLTWRDADGLEAAAPLELLIAARADEPPMVVMLDVPQTRGILLETDTLKFKVAARDDFGIRRVGLEWEGLADAFASSGAASDAAALEKGERILQAGGGDVESLDAVATFCPDALGIRPQPIAIRAFAEDFMPGRGRAVSSPLVLYVVDRAEHALVLNTRLQQFRQQASEVRDREMGLLATNKELRKLPAEQLASPESRGRLEAQAAAEEANARRLERLVDEGAELVREALKNPEFEANTLEQLAEDIQTLADIAESRMPGVADLLAQAQHDIRAGQEATWTLMALSAWLPPDAMWTAGDGERWTTERVVKMEAAADIPSAACGGAHRLYGLAAAVDAHRRATGEPPSGGWADAAHVVDASLERARRFQQPDGSFAVRPFERPGTSPDVFDRLSATGHVLEVLAVSLDDERLAEPWVRRAAERLVSLMEQTADLDVECGGLYHAAHGLALYRSRICPP